MTKRARWSASFGRAISFWGLAELQAGNGTAAGAFCRGEEMTGTA